MNAVYWQGVGMGASLIVAIGAQNAHVLRMGLLRRHAGLTAAVCALCDVVLIAAGLIGMGTLMQKLPGLIDVARWGGAAYLCWYAFRTFRAAFDPNALIAAREAAVVGWRPALAAALGFSLLNPHVYLDTVVLLGSIGGRHAWPDRVQFGLGAMTASLLWFFGLALGAHLLAPWFARPGLWRVIDLLTGTVMLALAIGLVI